MTLAYAIVGDGPTDQVLSVFVDEALARGGVTPQYIPVDLRRAPKTATLEARIYATHKLSQADLLFVTRDAENGPPDERFREIRAASAKLEEPPPCVPVVFIRMLEAWLLLEEGAIRRAAGFPNGKQPLAMPRPATIEGLSDPKHSLHALVTAAKPSAQGRSRSRSMLSGVAYDVASQIHDFGALTALSAYRQFEADLAEVLGRVQGASPTPPTAARPRTA